jgi:hypothetical protein
VAQSRGNSVAYQTLDKSKSYLGSAAARPRQFTGDVSRRDAAQAQCRQQRASTATAAKIRASLNRLGAVRFWTGRLPF